MNQWNMWGGYTYELLHTCLMNILFLRQITNVCRQKPPRSEQANSIQRTKLMSLVDEHPVLITQKLTNDFTFADLGRLWNNVAGKLNVLGPKKDVKGWKRVCKYYKNNLWHKKCVQCKRYHSNSFVFTWQYLSDQKTRIKRKKSDVVLSAKKSGGGQKDVPDLEESEEKLIAAMGSNIVISGDEHVHEYGCRTNSPDTVSPRRSLSYECDGSTTFIITDVLICRVLRIAQIYPQC